jgi:hypothetical protein
MSFLEACNLLNDSSKNILYIGVDHNSTQAKYKIDSSGILHYHDSTTSGVRLTIGLFLCDTWYITLRNDPNDTKYFSYSDFFKIEKKEEEKIDGRRIIVRR